KVVEHQGEQGVLMSSGKLGELYVERRIEDRLHCQIERHKSLSPVVGDEHLFHGLAEGLPSGILFPTLSGVCARGQLCIMVEREAFGPVSRPLDAAEFVSRLKVRRVRNER